jgi:hypothetical protein
VVVRVESIVSALFFATVAALGSPAVATGQHGIPAFRVTQEGGGLGVFVSESVTLSFDRHDRSWFAERRRSDSNWCGLQVDHRCTATHITVHDWASSRNCPALATVIKKLPEARRASLAIEREQALSRLRIQVTDTPLLSLQILHRGAVRGGTQSE